MKQTRQTPYSILRNQKPENDAISGFSQCHQSQFLSLEQLVSAEYYAHCGQTLFEITNYSHVHDIYFFHTFDSGQNGKLENTYFDKLF